MLTVGESISLHLAITHTFLSQLLQESITKDIMELIRSDFVLGFFHFGVIIKIVLYYRCMKTFINVDFRGELIVIMLKSCLTVPVASGGPPVVQQLKFLKDSRWHRTVGNSFRSLFPPPQISSTICRQSVRQQSNPFNHKSVWWVKQFKDCRGNFPTNSQAEREIYRNGFNCCWRRSSAGRVDGVAAQWRMARVVVLEANLLPLVLKYAMKKQKKKKKQAFWAFIQIHGAFFKSHRPCRDTLQWKRCFFFYRFL